jgi:hypothetical protein
MAMSIKCYAFKSPLLLFVGFSLGAFASFIVYTHAPKPIQQIVKNNENCGFAEKFFIYKIESRYLIYCNDGIYLGKYLTESVESYSLLDTKHTFPDLFEYNKLPVIKLSKAFPTSKPQFIAITGLYDTGLSSHESLAIYKLTDSGAVQVLKKGLSDISGRWTGYQISDTNTEFSAMGDLGELACGGCRIEWVDFYKWNDKTNTFELDNSSHKNDFSTLLKKYATYSIDQASQQSKQTFSKAKETINNIISGENVTFSAL